MHDAIKTFLNYTTRFRITLNVYIVDYQDLPSRSRETKDDGIILKLDFIPLIYTYVCTSSTLNVIKTKGIKIKPCLRFD